MNDLVFIWGMIAGGGLVGVVFHLYARGQRRKLMAAERWIAELEQRAEAIWTALRR